MNFLWNLIPLALVILSIIQVPTEASSIKQSRKQSRDKAKDQGGNRRDKTNMKNPKMSDDYKLIFAHIIYRHGARNIFTPSYPKDPYGNESFWPGGSAALTNVGKKQQFELGKYLRRRYDSLIGTGFNNVYIHSTDTDRTLMSAQCNAAGMFPPSGDALWTNELKWQPIPIHTIKLSDDYTLGNIPSIPDNCPRHAKLYWKFVKSSEFKYQIEQNTDFVKFLEASTGLVISSSLQIFILCNVLFVQKDRRFVLPDWTKNISKHTDDTIEQIVGIQLQAFTHTKEMKKFGAGFLLKEMLDRFKNKAQSKLQPDRSLWVISAHDVTIVNILNALGLFEPHLPAFASSLFFELYKRNENYFVQLLYRKTPTENVPPLNIPNCGVMCPLEKFYDLYQDILPKEHEKYEALCKNTL